MQEERPVVLGTKTVYCWSWRCRHCDKECIPVRSSSFCICGHRLQYHESGSKEEDFKCKKCPCKKFFFIMTEGSWALRCRCKHKHTDHDPNTRECKKPKCSCKCFDSPWVCNCDHGWAEHDHVLVKKEVPDLSSLGVQEADLADSIAPEVNNYAALKRGAGYNDCAFP